MPLSQTSILVVNADDLGWNAGATDRTIECFEAGLIGSSTLMVHMEDSERAAALGRERGLPLGLHLNLTDPFTAPGALAAARQRQATACRAFGGGRLRLRSWSYDPRLRGVVADAVRDQLERFRELVGAAPTHVDGHNHVQVCPNVILAAPLRGMKLRNALWSWPSSRTAMAGARELRRALTGRSHLTPRYLLDIAALARLDPASARRRLELCRANSVEVMCHPGFGHELAALRDPAWVNALEGLPLGSYRDVG